MSGVLEDSKSVLAPRLRRVRADHSGDESPARDACSAGLHSGLHEWISVAIRGGAGNKKIPSNAEVQKDGTADFRHGGEDFRTIL